MSLPAQAPALAAAHTPTRTLLLRISSLGRVVVDEPLVVSIRAQDASGSFGLLPGHADFLTVLPVSVLSWRVAGSAGADVHGPDWRHCAVRAGVLTVQAGQVLVASREAILGEDLNHLEHEVLAQLRSHQHADDQARRDARALEARTLTELLRYLRPLRAGRSTGV